MRLLRRVPSITTLLLGVASCTPIAPPTSLPAAAAPASVVEREIHRLINQHRIRRGLPELRYDDRVGGIAREHSAAMAAGQRPFGHAGFEQRGSAVGAFLPYRGFAENVALESRSGAALASLIVTGWLGSPPHRRNIEGTHDVTGIGLARDRQGVTYATQLFVSP